MQIELSELLNMTVHQFCDLFTNNHYDVLVSSGQQLFRIVKADRFFWIELVLNITLEEVFLPEQDPKRTKVTMDIQITQH